MVPALRAGSKPALFAGACALFFLVACAPTRRHDEALSPALDFPPAELRTLYLIHGDGEYTWHDSTGRRLRADEEALRQAREAGRKHARGEVFVFHLRKGRSGWFREHDGRFEHYRGGRLVDQGDYVRAEKDSGFEAEAAILRRRQDASPLPATRLAYFGHELTLRDAPGYFPSNPDRPFSQARFARALRALQPGEKAFDGIVLSMCYGGNPELIQALQPLAPWMVASPAYLHLSYLDVATVADPAIRSTADSVAARSFARLSREVRTEVTVAVYEAQRARPPAAPAPANASKPLWKDCAVAPGFDSAAAATGATLLYRPPLFGPGRDVAARSAWQCAF